jgi:hypothetical protein
MKKTGSKKSRDTVPLSTLVSDSWRQLTNEWDFFHSTDAGKLNDFFSYPLNIVGCFPCSGSVNMQHGPTRQSIFFALLFWAAGCQIDFRQEGYLNL